MAKTIFQLEQLYNERPLGLYENPIAADSKLYFYDASIKTGSDSKFVMSPLKNAVSSISGAWIDFQLQTNSNALHFDITFPASTVGQFRRCVFTYTKAGKIKGTFSNEFALYASLPNAGTLVVKGGIPLGFIDLECTDILGKFKTYGSLASLIEADSISNFASAGGSGGESGSGSGSELLDLRFVAKVDDNFDEIPGTESTVIDASANKTDSTIYDAGNSYYRMSYDAGLTVTGTGVSMVLSAAPSFTIKLGDILIVGTEAKVISALTSQTVFDVESAFTADPSAAACCVSQVVHTVDLNAYNEGGLGVSMASLIPNNVSNVLVAYADTLLLGDVIPDYNTAPVVAYTISGDGTAWSNVLDRATNITDIESVQSVPVPGPNFLIRFFPNFTSGNGAVNLLGFKAFWHEEEVVVAGVAPFSVFARPFSSAFVNCTHAVVSGKSQLTFSQPYTAFVDAANPSGSSIQVYLGGQLLPRYHASLIDLSQGYFKEINGSIIELDDDYSAINLPVIVKFPKEIIDPVKDVPVEVFQIRVSNIGATSALGFMHYRAAFPFSLSKVYVQIFNKGAVVSGILEVDVKKNTTPDDVGMISILATTAQVNFATAVDYDSDEGVIVSPLVEEGDWLRLDLSQVPAGFNGTFYITVLGSLYG